jgi:hypothetical protein
LVKKMTRQHIDRGSLIVLVLLVWLTQPPAISADAQTGDPLPSWNDGTAKRTIVTFVSDGYAGIVSAAGN